MGQKPSRFVWIKKAGALVEGEDLINRQSIHLDAVGVIDVGQSRQAVDDFLILGINGHMVWPNSYAVFLRTLLFQAAAQPRNAHSLPPQSIENHAQ